MLQHTDEVSVAYIISLFQLKIRSILPHNFNEVKMYFKNIRYTMAKASGMFLLLCCFSNMYAQLYFGKGYDLNIKDSGSFKENQGILRTKDKMLVPFKNKIYPEQSLKLKELEMASLIGMQIRSPPSFKYILY